jgi:hypothetical protein
MNERINGLWWKARIGYNNQSCDPEVLEKFAELIVRECIDTIVRDTANYPGEGMMAYYQGVQDAGKRIKQHFGVEE